MLLATEEIWDGPFHQSVILVLSHEHDLGTVGLILNRPGPQRVHSLAGLKWDLAEFFADSQVTKVLASGTGSSLVFRECRGLLSQREEELADLVSSFPTTPPPPLPHSLPPRPCRVLNVPPGHPRSSALTTVSCYCRCSTGDPWDWGR